MAPPPPPPPPWVGLGSFGRSSFASAPPDLRAAFAIPHQLTRSQPSTLAWAPSTTFPRSSLFRPSAPAGGGCISLTFVTLIDQGPTIICHHAPCLPLPFSVFIPLGGFSYHLHFTEKETVAHGDKVPCLESAKQRKELGFTPGILVTCSLSPQPRPSPQCLS